jgi:3-oxoadipate enol-lactonase
MELSREDSGSGSPVVVFIHGFPLDRRMWRSQIDAMAAAGGRAIAIDLAGFGESPLRAGDVDGHADDVARTLDSLGVERAIVVGLSMGGYIALALARRHPKKLAGLLLADTKAGPDNEEARKGRVANIERVEKEGVAAVFDAMAPKVFTANTDPTVIELLRGLAAAQSPLAAQAALTMMRDRPDATNSLSAIAVPTRVVVGSADAATPPSEAEIMARAIPGAALVTIEGAGHFTNVERPEEFNRVLLDLLQHVRNERA